MNITQLFDFKTEGEEIETLSPDEFVSKTKSLLEKIDKEYATSWYSRKLSDDEYELAPCDQCKGNGCFKKGNVQIDCVQDREQGECYERSFDSELFSTSIELIMFNETDFYKLLQSRVEVLKSNSLPQTNQEK